MEKETAKDLYWAIDDIRELAIELDIMINGLQQMKQDDNLCPEDLEYASHKAYVVRDKIEGLVLEYRSVLLEGDTKNGKN